MKTIFIYLLLLPIPYLALWAQEPFYEVADKDALNKAYKERHYKIKVTFRVIDEQGEPVSDADIDVGIDSLLHGDGYNNYRGKTGPTGLFTVESRGRGCTEVLVQKKGYYESRPDVRWDGRLNPGGEEMHKNGGFRPWNPTIDVMIKKIGKPIPMIVRLANGGSKSRMKPTSSQIGKELAWDLVKGDWVAPDGGGKVSDLIVKFESAYVDEHNRAAKVRIKFANGDDGCIPLHKITGEESLLSFPREAPVEGYDTRELIYSSEYKEHKDASGYKETTFTKLPIPPHEGYLLRLRTRKDENGRIVSAIYAKITNPLELDDILFQGRRRLFLNFDYYLNPTPNDRNLEYDQKNNLAPEADRGLTWPP